jgi:hypothetical protein
MAVIVTDNRTTRNEADAITGWTGTGTLTAFTSDPVPIEATAQIGATVGVAIFDIYHTAASANLSDAVVYCWTFSRLALGTTTAANGGLMIYLGDGTHAGAWKIAGSDKASFRHDTGPVGWQCPALDTTSLPASPVNRQGSGGASVNFSAITRVGVTVNSLVAAPGMNPTFHVDIVRILDPSLNNGCALTITGGTSGSPGTFSEIAAEDRLTTNLKAHGIIRELGTGVFGVQGPLRFGNPTGSDSSWFEDKNATLIFEDRGFRTTLYKVFITDNGVGTTTFILGTKVGTGSDAIGVDGCALIAPPGVGAEFDAASDADVTDVFIYGTRISGFTNGIKLRQSHELIGCIVSGSGLIEPNGATLVNTSVSSTTDPAKALLWNINLDTLNRLDNMSFSGPGHAIELGPSTPSSITLSGVEFISYGSNDTTSAAIYNNSGKAITIDIVGGGNTPTIRNGTSASTIVNNNVLITLTGLKADSEVRAYYDVAGQNGDEIAGIENSGTSFSFSVSANTIINIIINHLNYLPADIWQFDTGSSDSSIPISQFIDRNYFNPPGPDQLAGQGLAVIDYIVGSDLFTSETTYQLALELNIDVNAGYYIIMWDCDLARTIGSGVFAQARVTIDDSDEIGYWEGSLASDSYRYNFSGFYYRLLNGEHSIKIEYEGNGNRVDIIRPTIQVLGIP